jgi:hypothetical protein
LIAEEPGEIRNIRDILTPYIESSAFETRLGDEAEMISARAVSVRRTTGERAALRPKAKSTL